MKYTNNKRESFRVDDRVTLNISFRTELQVAEIVRDFDYYRSQVCLRTHLQYRRENLLPVLKVISRKDQEIGSYLRELESQIDDIANSVMSTVKRDSDLILESASVDISANGMRFCMTEPMVIGQKVELTIFPDQMPVFALAEVVRIDQSDNENWISVKFTAIHEEDKESLIRYAVRVQQQVLQAKRVG